MKKGFRPEPRKAEIPEERLSIQLATAENIAKAYEMYVSKVREAEMARTQLQNVIVSVFTERGITNAELVRVEGGNSPALIVKVLERQKKK